MGTGKSLASVTCEKCGSVVMETFLATHMKYVHTDAADRLHDPADAGHGLIKKRSKAPQEQKGQPPVKVAPVPKPEPTSPQAAKATTLSLKKPRITVYEVERRVIVVQDNKPKPKAKLLPAKPARLRCTRCGMDFSGRDAASAHLTCPALSKEAKRGKSRPSKAPRSFLPDGFESSPSVRTVSGGLPGLGKRSR